MRICLSVAISLVVVACCVSPLSYGQASAKHEINQSVSKHKVLFQVSDSDSKKWDLTLNNIKNLQQDVGAEHLQIEVVAYGPGIDMLKIESNVAPRIADEIATGVKFVACEHSMHGASLTKADMLPDIDYAPTGVFEIMKKEEEGYSYVRP